MTINSQEYREALQNLSRNNTNNSASFNGLLAVLEGAEGNIQLKGVINNYLAESLLIKVNSNGVSTNTLTETSEQFDSLGTIREKVAYVVSLAGEGENTQQKCNNLINSLERDVINHVDLSESAILRNAALNRFSIQLSPEKNADLIRIENQVKAKVEEKIPGLLPQLGLQDESPAQRIQKLDEIIQYMLKKGILTETPTGFQGLKELLNPLRELDQKYRNLNHARNLFYTYQRNSGELGKLRTTHQREVEQQNNNQINQVKSFEESQRNALTEFENSQLNKRQSFEESQRDDLREFEESQRSALTEFEAKLEIKLNKTKDNKKSQVQNENENSLSAFQSKQASDLIKFNLKQEKDRRNFEKELRKKINTFIETQEKNRIKFNNNLIKEREELAKKQQDELNELFSMGYGEIFVLNKGQKDKLNSAITALTGKDLSAYYDEYIKGKDDSVDLMGLYNSIASSHSNLEDKLKESGLTINEFQKYFLYYFAEIHLKISKAELEEGKKVFTDKQRDFENDVDTWRKIQRERLVTLCENINTNIDAIDNLFQRDRKLFIRTGDEEKDRLLEEGLRIVINRRYANTPIDVRNNLIEAILCENDNVNELYYGDKNLFRSLEENSPGQNFFNNLSKAGKALIKAGQHTEPIIGGLLKFTKGALEVGGNAVSKVILGATGGLNKILPLYHGWVDKERKGFFVNTFMLPFKLGKILTKPTSWLISGIDTTAKLGDEIFKNSYNGLNTAVANASDNKIDSLFDIFRVVYAKGVYGLGRGTEYVSDKVFDSLKTSQKRELLSKFYQTRNSGEIVGMLEAIDIANILSDSGPRLFDNDGVSEALGFNIQPEKIDEIMEEVVGVEETHLPENYTNFLNLVNSTKLPTKAKKKIGELVTISLNPENIPKNRHNHRLKIRINNILKYLKENYESNKDLFEKLGIKGDTINMNYGSKTTFAGELHLFSMNITKSGNLDKSELTFDVLINNLTRSLTEI